MAVDGPVIDFHSHVLPEMDDGSKSTAMSLAMLGSAQKMGVDILVAAPHFYGFRESVSAFLSRRERCWEKLAQAMEEKELPDVRLGAEVAFFSGLTGLDRLEPLCIAGTRTLLLEMPFAPWTSFELDAVSALCLDRGYQVVLAHLERFFPLQENRGLLERLLELPVWVQINAEALRPRFRRNRWLELFRNGRAHLLGSDCHNLTSRPPNLAAGRRILRKKAGPEVLDRMDALGRRLLGLDTGGDGNA